MIAYSSDITAATFDCTACGFSYYLLRALSLLARFYCYPWPTVKFLSDVVTCFTGAFADCLSPVVVTAALDFYSGKSCCDGFVNRYLCLAADASSAGIYWEAIAGCILVTPTRFVTAFVLSSPG